eukprot:11009345-Lingulodinium_polyedra.AAC.1
MAQGWKSLMSGLSIEPEQRYNERGVMYFGCTIERTNLALRARDSARRIVKNCNPGAASVNEEVPRG